MPRPHNNKNYNRVTVMMDPDIDKIIKYNYASKIIQCADEGCTLPSMNYSRMVNELMRAAFKGGADRRVITNL